MLVTAKGIRWESNLESDLQHGFGKASQVELEGDFDARFAVYAKADLQVPARQILTPDIMQLISVSQAYQLFVRNPKH